MASSEHAASVPPPPPPSGLAPPPPPPLGIGSGPGGPPKGGSTTGKGSVWKKPESIPAEEVNDRLLADIRAGVNLKPTKTRDRSSAVLRRKGNFK
uniref:WH2 domain-containing protein n=1 Tax=Anopheles epiroticus TaxID=199890 RepID=A0A182PBW4_9DIPT